MRPLLFSLAPVVALAWGAPTAEAQCRGGICHVGVHADVGCDTGVAVERSVVVRRTIPVRRLVFRRRCGW
jgi:hypothetical protein